MGETVSNMICGFDAQPGTPAVEKGKVMIYHKGNATEVYNVDADSADLDTAVDDNDPVEFASILSSYSWWSTYSLGQRAAWWAAAKKEWGTC